VSETDKYAKFIDAYQRAALKYDITDADDQGAKIIAFAELYAAEKVLLEVIRAGNRKN